MCYVREGVESLLFTVAVTCCVQNVFAKLREKILDLCIECCFKDVVMTCMRHNMLVLGL